MRKVLALFGCILVLGLLVACVETEESTTSETGETKEQVILDNDLVKATFLGITERFGYIMMDIRLENKTEKDMIIIPMDSSVDDVMVRFVSGMHMTILPGKSYNESWTIGSVPEDNVEFKMSIRDGDMAELLLTDVIRIEM